MANFRFTAVFTDNGAPKTGIASPVVNVWRLSDSVQVLTNESLTEVGGGFYQYYWTSYDADETYAVQYDAGTDTDIDSRYSFDVPDSYLADLEGALPDSFWDSQLEGTFTGKQIMRVLSAALAGLASGGPNGSVYRDINDTKNRISSVTNSNGDRTSITLDVTD